jgi:hypothetical protein
MQHENQQKIQLTVDRARQYRNETFDAGADISEQGLADWREIRKGLDAKFRADYRREKFTGMAEIDALLSTPIRAPGSFCKTPAAAA